MTVIDLHSTTARLLATLNGSVANPSLAHHLQIHGPPLVPTGTKGAWSDQFIDLIARSGLTGRGGAAFPTATKIASVRSQSPSTILVVNAMEGEPSSQKDRLLATVAPHLVLEGAELVATAIDAVEIRLCVARPHRAAVAAWRMAANERKEAGVALRPTTVFEPPGRYVGGEESALVRWLNGGDARPTFRSQRPPRLIIDGRTALVDNAETLAHIALIARHGASWFREVGTDDACGTGLFTVTGAVDAPGVYEAPFGTTVAALIHQAGTMTSPGGILLGGYGGTWLPLAALETPLSPAALSAQGCSIGTGVVIVLPSHCCGLVETARICRWMADESAGQCGPCVFGLPALALDLEQLAYEGLDHETASRLWDRLGLIEGRGACRHPDGVVRFVRSALHAFSDDVALHLQHGPCAGIELRPTLSLPDSSQERDWR
jgi:NADH:ubiquinone oxidoreductase subunit F (NADH-binding)